MGREEPLRISCDDCPGGAECRDCLVEFFLGERNARIVRLGGDAGRSAGTALPSASRTSRRCTPNLRAAP